MLLFVVYWGIDDGFYGVIVVENLIFVDVMVDIGSWVYGYSCRSCVE